MIQGWKEFPGQKVQQGGKSAVRIGQNFGAEGPSPESQLGQGSYRELGLKAHFSGKFSLMFFPRWGFMFHGSREHSTPFSELFQHLKAVYEGGGVAFNSFSLFLCINSSTFQLPYYGAYNHPITTLPPPLGRKKERKNRGNKFFSLPFWRAQTSLLSESDLTPSLASH